MQISVVRREQAEDGTETLPEADDAFLVFPAQLILLPKEKRTVRVQWLGPVKPEKELAYRLVAEQLPVDLGRAGDTENSLRLLVRYQTAIYIVPSGIRSNVPRDLVVQRAEPSRDQNGQQTMDVYVANYGLAHVQIRNAQLTAKSSNGGKTVKLSSQSLIGSVLGEKYSGWLRSSLQHSVAIRTYCGTGERNAGDTRCPLEVKCQGRMPGASLAVRVYSRRRVDVCIGAGAGCKHL